MIGTWPASTSFSAGPAPRYGIWTMKVLVETLNCSPSMWPKPQVPDEAYEYLPGLAFSTARNSL